MNSRVDARVVANLTAGRTDTCTNDQTHGKLDPYIAQSQRQARQKGQSYYMKTSFRHLLIFQTLPPNMLNIILYCHHLVKVFANSFLGYILGRNFHFEILTFSEFIWCMQSFLEKVIKISAGNLLVSVPRRYVLWFINVICCYVRFSIISGNMVI